GGPRDHLVDAELGGHLNGQKVPVVLGQCLHQREGGLRRSFVRHVLDGDVQLTLAHAGDTAPGHPPGAVCEEQLLTVTQPRDGRGVPALRSVEPDHVAGGDRLERPRAHEEQGRAHLCEKASLSLPNRPALAGVIRPSGRDSPRSSASCASSSRCRSSSLVGTRTSRCTRRSPRPVPRRWVTPCPCRVMMSWPWLPARRSTSVGPSKVSTVSVAPRAAAVIGTWTVQCRSSPRRWKVSWGRTAIST